MDADLQNDPSDLPRMLETIQSGDWDMVAGTRVKSRADGDNWLRRTSSKIANRVRNGLSNETISDAGCTYRIFRRECIDRIKFYKGMHRFLPTLFRIEGFRVTECDVKNNPRHAGVSKYGVWNRVFRALADLLAVRWMKKRHIGYRIGEQVGAAGAECDAIAVDADETCVMEKEGEHEHSVRRETRGGRHRAVVEWTERCRAV